MARKKKSSRHMTPSAAQREVDTLRRTVQELTTQNQLLKHEAESARQLMKRFHEEAIRREVDNQYLANANNFLELQNKRLYAEREQARERLEKMIVKRDLLRMAFDDYQPGMYLVKRLQ